MLNDTQYLYKYGGSYRILIAHQHTFKLDITRIKNYSAYDITYNVNYMSISN